MTLQFCITDDLRWFAGKLGVEASTVSKGLTAQAYGYIIQKAAQLVDDKLTLDDVAQHFATIPTKLSMTNCNTRRVLQGAYTKFIFPYFAKGKADVTVEKVADVVAQLRKDQRSFHLQFLDLLVVKMKDDDRDFFFDYVRTELGLPALPPLKRKQPKRAEYTSVWGTPWFQRLLTEVHQDPSLKILRVHEKMGKLSSPKDLMVLFHLIKHNETIEVLNIQNLGRAFTDEVMENTIAMLKYNKNIWALNVGENGKVHRKMWVKFAAALPKTNICFLYAGSESSVNGKLKKAMRDAARLNRNRLCVGTWWEEHKETTWKVENMWWNPKKSKHFV